MSKSERRVGTVSRGIRCPIIRTGDDLGAIVTESVLLAAESEGFELRDRDVIAVTESIVARAQGNYCTVEDIAEDVKNKLGGGTIGVIFPILSRNRFAICLRGIAKGARKVVLMLSYPSDEVGNELVSLDKIDEAGVNPYSDVLTLAKYRELFGVNKHEFTGVDYVENTSLPASITSSTTETSSASAGRSARSSLPISLKRSWNMRTIFSTAIFTPESVPRGSFWRMAPRLSAASMRS